MISFDQAQDYIQSLDLSYIVNAMCRDDYPLPRWIKPEAEKACQLYKNFLLLQKKHLPLSLVPSRIIDECWHNHILHTKNYMADCQAIFGHYLHHEPAIPTDNTAQLISDFKKTKALYLDLFGETL